MAYLTLIGVFNDGSPRAATVPENPATAIKLARGIAATIRVEVVLSDGTQPVLDPLTAAPALRVKRSTAEDFLYLNRTGTLRPDIGNGWIQFAISASDFTAQWPAGRYVFDIGLTYNGARNLVVPLSVLTLQPTTLVFP